MPPVRHDMVRDDILIYRGFPEVEPTIFKATAYADGAYGGLRQDPRKDVSPAERQVRLYFRPASEAFVLRPISRFRL